MQDGGRIAPVSLLRRGHTRTADYTANAVDERRKLAFAANLHGGIELKKCRKQGSSGSLELVRGQVSISGFFHFTGKRELVYCKKWRRVEWIG